MAPDLPRISQALGVMSSGERVFIATLASFYSAHDSQQLLHRAGVRGVSTRSAHDAYARQVISRELGHERTQITAAYLRR